MNKYFSSKNMKQNNEAVTYIKKECFLYIVKENKNK